MDDEEISNAATKICQDGKSVLMWETICEALGHSINDMKKWSNLFENSEHIKLFRSMLNAWKNKNQETATLEALVGIFSKLGLHKTSENLQGITNLQGFTNLLYLPRLSESGYKSDEYLTLTFKDEGFPGRENEHKEKNFAKKSKSKKKSFRSIFMKKRKNKSLNEISEVPLNISGTMGKCASLRISSDEEDTNWLPKSTLKTDFNFLSLETEPRADRRIWAENLINIIILCSNKIPIRCSMLYNLYNSVFCYNLEPDNFFVGIDYMKCSLRLISSEIPQINSKNLKKETQHPRINNLLRLNPSEQNIITVEKKVEFPDKQIELEKDLAKGICALINKNSINRDNTNDLLHFVHMYNVIHPSAYQICRNSICTSLEINGFRYQLGELDCIKVWT